MLAVYGVFWETLAMMVINMCSFLEKGPGLRLIRVPNSVTPQSGRVCSHNLPSGNASSWAALDETLMLGCRIEKSWLMPPRSTEKRRPMVQARMVEQGVLGSSWLSTTARTSEYGLLLVMSAASTFIS